MPQTGACSKPCNSADKGLQEIDIIVPATDILTGGKFSKEVHKAVDTYLRGVIVNNPRAALALNNPTEEEAKIITKLMKGKKKGQ